MNTFNSQRCDYIEVLNSYLKEAASEETEYDVDAIRVRLNFVSQLTGEQFILNKDYLLSTHQALLCKGLIGVHIPNLPGTTITSNISQWCVGTGIDSDKVKREQTLKELLESGIQIKGYPLFPSDCAPRMFMHGDKGIVSSEIPESELPTDMSGQPAKLTIPIRMLGESERLDPGTVFDYYRKNVDLPVFELNGGFPLNDFQHMPNPFPKTNFAMHLASKHPELVRRNLELDMEMPLSNNTKSIMDDIVSRRHLAGLSQAIDEMTNYFGYNVDNEIKTGLNAVGEMIKKHLDTSEETADIPFEPISMVQICSLKHHPAVVNEQHRSKAFLTVMPAAHAEKLMKNMQCMVNMMDERDDPEYYESVKMEIKRLRYIAEGDIKSHHDVDSKWLD